MMRIPPPIAKLYRKLVIRNEAGRIEGVRSDALAPMLLTRMQLQQRKAAAQDKRIASQSAASRELWRQQFAAHAEQVRMQQQMA